jgi:hypothetical protein
LSFDSLPVCPAMNSFRGKPLLVNFWDMVSALREELFIRFLLSGNKAKTGKFWFGC